MSIHVKLRNYKGEYIGDEFVEIDEETTFSNVMNQVFNRIYFSVVYMELNFDERDYYDPIENYDMRIHEYIDTVNGTMNSQIHGLGLLTIKIGREKIRVNVNIFDNPIMIDYDENTTFMYLIEDILPRVATLQMVEDYIIKNGTMMIPYTEIITEFNISFGNNPIVYAISDFDNIVSEFIEEIDGIRPVINITVEKKRFINAKINDLF